MAKRLPFDTEMGCKVAQSITIKKTYRLQVNGMHTLHVQCNQNSSVASQGC